MKFGTSRFHLVCVIFLSLSRNSRVPLLVTSNLFPVSLHFFLSDRKKDFIRDLDEKMKTIIKSFSFVLAPKE